MIGAVSPKVPVFWDAASKNEAHAKNTPQTAGVLKQVFQCWIQFRRKDH